MNSSSIIILLLILTLFVFYYCHSKSEQFENSSNINNNIDFYVITLSHRERLENITNQNKKLNANIIKTDAVDGKLLNQNDLLNKGEIAQVFFNNNELKRNKEIGCYKSHFNIYNLIDNNVNKKKYSIVLEDDFNVIPENIIEKIEKLLGSVDNLDFDIIFLGNTFDNHSNVVVKDNIYNIDKNKFTMGTFAYLVNNKNIKKIMEQTKLIDSPIDNKFDTLVKNNKLNAYVVYPNLINYMAEIKSDIMN